MKLLLVAWQAHMLQHSPLAYASMSQAYSSQDAMLALSSETFLNVHMKYEVQVVMPRELPAEQEAMVAVLPPLWVASYE